MKFKDRIVIYDLEATCTDDKELKPLFESEIIEIGAVDTLGNEYNTFVKPIINPELTDFCTSLTTIEQKDVENQREFYEVIPDFYEYIQGSTILSWGNYDKTQTIKELERTGDESLIKMVAYFQENHINMKEYYTKVTGVKARGMARALKHLNLDIVGTHHRGIDDARSLMLIFKTLQEKEKTQS